ELGQQSAGRKAGSGLRSGFERRDGHRAGRGRLGLAARIWEGLMFVSGRTINDQVEDIHLLLIADEKYRSYLNAVCNEQAVTGSLAFDDLMAAQAIRDKATEVGSELAKEKLARPFPRLLASCCGAMEPRAKSGVAQKDDRTCQMILKRRT